MANKRNPIKIKKLIEGKTLKELGEYFETKTKSDLEQVYDNIRTLINKQFAKSLKVSSVVNMAKYRREIFDFEIICDCIIEAIGPMYQTESMKKWDPYPFKNEGKKLAAYIKKRYHPVSDHAREVPDKFIKDLLKGDTATKPQTKAVEKEEEKTPGELINGEQSKQWTYTDDYNLCERLCDNSYVPNSEEELRMKNKTFQSNRTKWWDRPKRKYRDKFINIFEELEPQIQMEVTKFSEILNVKSDYHRVTLLNSFINAVNRPDGKLYEKANKKRASIKNTQKGKILLLD